MCDHLVKLLRVLVNERLARDGELGPVSLGDVRGAVAYGVHPLVDTISLDGDHVTIEARWVESRSRGPRRRRPVIHRSDAAVCGRMDRVGSVPDDKVSVRVATSFFPACGQ
ncbi:MAG TPA: hypothetical protein VGD01_09995 [Candidatus Elarobacter sp.]|jgi:hypothetical protein